MKKFLLLGAAITMLSVTACKKDYTCKCTGTGILITEVEYEKVKKDDAESSCKEVEDANKIFDPAASCSI